MKYILISDKDLVAQLIKNRVNPITISTDGREEYYYFFEYNDNVISWISVCEAIINADKIINKEV